MIWSTLMQREAKKEVEREREREKKTDKSSVSHVRRVYEPTSSTKSNLLTMVRRGRRCVSKSCSLIKEEEQDDQALKNARDTLDSTKDEANFLIRQV